MSSLASLRTRLHPVAAACAGLIVLSSAAVRAAAAPAPGTTTGATAAVATATSTAATAETAVASAQQVVVTGTSDAGRASDTATGLDLTARETPQSITVIDRQLLDDFALTDINAALSLTPGITVERVETDRTYYTAHGFDVINFQVDGIGLPFTNGNQAGEIDTALYDRIEVLRGANGLLSSTGNPSATVNFVRKRPTRDFEASAALTLGSWNDRRLEGDVGGALDAGGHVRARLVAVDERSDSYLQRYRRDDKAFAGLVDIDLAPRTTLELGFAQQDTDPKSPMWGALPLTYSDGTPANYDRGASTAADWAYWNTTDRRAHAELTHGFGDGWEGKVVVTRRTQAQNSALFYVYGNEDPATHEGALSYPSAFAGEYDQTMVDLRLSGPFHAFGRTHSLSLGADWARENARERSGYGAADTIGAPLPDLDTWGGVFPEPAFDASTDGSDWRTVRRSVFGALHLNAADALNLVLGVNATRIESSGTNYGVAHAYARSGVTPYVGAVWDFSDSTSAYASFTRIFSPQTEIDRSHQPLMPIQGRNVEAGLKSEWLAKRLETTVSVFQTRQDNTATQDADTDFNPTTYHGENAVSTGFEAEAAGRLAAGWEVQAGWSQMRIKGDDGQPARTFVPRRLLRLATTWTLPGLPAAKVGGSLKWQGETSTIDGTTRVSQPAYALAGLMASYDITPHWKASVNVDNVTNRKYWQSLYWTQSYYGAPRNVSATLRWTY